MAAERTFGFAPDWHAFSQYVSEIGEAVALDGAPDTVVGVLRGGMIPAVQLAHLLGVRTVRAIEVTHTLSDGVDSAKTPRPTVTNKGSLGDLSRQDVLIVDDIVGSGLTMLTCRGLVERARASRVRTAALTVNSVNWDLARDIPPHEELTYVGHIFAGWVTFPWEHQ